MGNGSGRKNLDGFKPPVSFESIFNTKTDHDLEVCWYGGISKNSKLGGSPLVEVCFAKLGHNEALGSVELNIPMTFLGSLRVGSVWRAGKWVRETPMDLLAQTPVAFKKNRTWRFVTLADTPLAVGDILNDYRIFGTWLIEVDFGEGQKLLIPCMEFFIRCFGRSSESSRILATYPWTDVLKRFFYEGAVSDQDKKIYLRWGISQGEATFLWHMLHDPYTKNVCRKIYADLEAGFPGGYGFFSGDPLLQIGPWFEGPALIEAKGRWLVKDKTFLCLQVTGFSEPSGPPVVVERSSNERSEILTGRYTQRQKRQLPEDQRASMTDRFTPDTDSETLVVPDPPLKLLGEKRPVTVTTKRTTSPSGKAIPGTKNLDLFATGESAGTGKGIGRAEFIAKLAWDSQGTLTDVWLACEYLVRKYPDRLHSVEWFTFKEGFNRSAPPKLELLKPLDESLAAAIRNWVYLDVRERILRGLLIIRIKAGDRSFFVIESQRNPTQADGDGEASSTRRQGLLVEITASAPATDEALKTICSNLRYVQGRAKQLRGLDYPSSSFNHDPKSKGDVLYAGVLVAHLAKLGLDLSD